MGDIGVGVEGIVADADNWSQPADKWPKPTDKVVKLADKWPKPADKCTKPADNHSHHAPLITTSASPTPGIHQKSKFPATKA